MAVPHGTCPHVTPARPCLGDFCAFCCVERLEIFWNRQEVSAELGEERPVRRVECLMDKWPEQRREIAGPGEEAA